MLEEMCTYVGQKFGNGKILVFVSVMVYVFWSNRLEQVSKLYL